MRIDQYRQSDRVRYANTVVIPMARYRDRMTIFMMHLCSSNIFSYNLNRNLMEDYRD